MANKTITRAQLEAPLTGIARALDEALPGMVGVTERVGFAVFVFGFGQKGNIAYVSNSERSDMIEAVKEWLAKQEAGLLTDPPGPTAQG
jgi:hypothetical protein